MLVVNVLKTDSSHLEKKANTNKPYPDQTAPEGVVWSGFSL